MRNELTLKYDNNDTQMLARSTLVTFLKRLKVQEMQYKVQDIMRCNK